VECWFELSYQHCSCRLVWNLQILITQFARCIIVKISEVGYFSPFTIVSCVRQYPPIIWIGPLVHNLYVHDMYIHKTAIGGSSTACTYKTHNSCNFKTDVLFVSYGISWNNMQILRQSVHLVEQCVYIVWWVVWSGDTNIYVPVKGLTSSSRNKKLEFTIYWCVPISRPTHLDQISMFLPTFSPVEGNK
jgi:hypothetical protein